MSHNEKDNHIVDYVTHIWVYLGLISLTAITVAIAGLNLKHFNLVVALLIASIKGILVMTYFMHLKYEEWLFKGMVFVAFLITATFFILTFIDILYR